jgi:hypothetical protein
VRFTDGAAVREVDAVPGERLLDVAQRHGQPLVRSLAQPAT